MRHHRIRKQPAQTVVLHNRLIKEMAACGFVCRSKSRRRGFKSFEVLRYPTSNTTEVIFGIEISNNTSFDDLTFLIQSRWENYLERCIEK